MKEKKTYQTPSIKVVEIASSAILQSSGYKTEQVVEEDEYTWE